jgi:hypothetical protein
MKLIGAVEANGYKSVETALTACRRIFHSMKGAIEDACFCARDDPCADQISPPVTRDKILSRRRRKFLNIDHRMKLPGHEFPVGFIVFFHQVMMRPTSAFDIRSEPAFRGTFQKRFEDVGRDRYHQKLTRNCWKVCTTPTMPIPLTCGRPRRIDSNQAATVCGMGNAGA